MELKEIIKKFSQVCVANGGGIYDRSELYGLKDIFPQNGVFEGEFRDDKWNMLIRYGRIAIFSEESIHEHFKI